MYHKAVLFNDYQTAELIMNTLDPKEQKRLGRTVWIFDHFIWDDFFSNIVHQGNYYKFNRNPHLLNKLLDTVGTTLVEASIFDPVWGIGLALNDPRRVHRDTWLGQNRLGFILTDLRDNVFVSFYIKEGVLYHIQDTRGRTKTLQDTMHQQFLPTLLRRTVIKQYHENSLIHAGFTRCLMAISRIYFWHKMHKEIKKYIREFINCQQGKSYHLF